MLKYKINYNLDLLKSLKFTGGADAAAAPTNYDFNKSDEDRKVEYGSLTYENLKVYANQFIEWLIEIAKKEYNLLAQSPAAELAGGADRSKNVADNLSTLEDIVAQLKQKRPLSVPVTARTQASLSLSNTGSSDGSIHSEVEEGSSDEVVEELEEGPEENSAEEGSSEGDRGEVLEEDEEEEAAAEVAAEAEAATKVNDETVAAAQVVEEESAATAAAQAQLIENISNLSKENLGGFKVKNFFSNENFNKFINKLNEIKQGITNSENKEKFDFYLLFVKTVSYNNIENFDFYFTFLKTVNRK